MAKTWVHGAQCVMQAEASLRPCLEHVYTAAWTSGTLSRLTPDTKLTVITNFYSQLIAKFVAPCLSIFELQNDMEIHGTSWHTAYHSTKNLAGFQSTQCFTRGLQMAYRALRHLHH